uniref:light-independent protochlorophyllide reductase subunit B n=1 Tax=Equisetum ramosissimum TaxID=195849 RepID=UPI001FCCFBFD|nr:light-independent protochlorophyllide reductase subunit B [Equisetum ramosissimum]UNI91850.1 light-independent protochlorophyllide reductase subunit B [Equisetum ramosissimum]UVF34862.1 light-independent protochlorophyllide reductase subunit B [Equisetum ramosissimum]WEI29953.1 photochlorophyllide reductase subunit B [Equisetum ramosissimum]
MKLVYWMYTGPAHVGILRVASSFKNVHAIMHAPLGDDYFNVMRSMLERERDFTPVTASIIDRYVLARGSKEKVFKNILRKDKEQRPDLIVLTPTCTSSILQEDLQNFVNRASLSARSDVILADVNHYRVNEFQAADRTLEQIVRYYLLKAREQGFLKNQSVTTVPSVNIIGIFTLGFHNQHDSRELKRLLEDLGIKINEIIPEGASVKNLLNLPQAWFNIVPYREVGLMTASFLQKDFGMPYILTTPMGIIDTADFIRQVQKNVNKLAPFFLKKTFDFESYIDYQTKFVSHAAWFSQSTDWQNLTGKKAVVFGDATHAASMTKIMVREMGIHVSCAGTFCKHDSIWFKEQVQDFCDEIIITEDHAEVANTISRLEPSAIFGTQMERHIGKRLGIPCGVISSPVHIQNFPLGYRPFLGFEGTNQIADLVYNSFTLGMEDHLLDVFGGHENKKVLTKLLYKKTKFYWTVESQIELQKIPGFVRDKIKRNTEKFARQKNVRTITVDIMYAAKKSFTNNLI